MELLIEINQTIHMELNLTNWYFWLKYTFIIDFIYMIQPKDYITEKINTQLKYIKK